MRLTVFTPTYNREKTLERLYRSLCVQTCRSFEWLVIDDGSTDQTRRLIESFNKEHKLPIRYIYKENGGLHTAYNTAYDVIDTELNVCVDSDDFMPANAVELILDKWNNEGSDKYAGIVGLDFYADSNRPIAGYFPCNLKQCYLLDLYIKRIHRGDSKIVLRTDLTKSVSPQEGFKGERFFNPVYMHLQICDDYPLLVLNENLCYVDSQQTDSMSKDIFMQYLQSPRSFAKLRILEMGLKRNNLTNRFRSAVHYVSSCLIGGEYSKIINRDHKLLTLAALLPGLIFSAYIRGKG